MLMRRRFRNLIFVLLRYAGLPFLLRHTVQKGKVTIVVYHAPTANRARDHFAALQKRYRVITLADYLRARADGTCRRLRGPSLIITLDDGHRSNFELKPVLEQLRIPATIFLCSGLVGTHRHFWWFHTANAREAEACKKMPDAERLRFLRHKDYRADQEYPDRQALSRSEIEQLKPYVDFQAHTVSHPILPACTAEGAALEISDCKTSLERSFNLKIKALAFPNGNYSEREIELARKSGYDCALTLDHGFNTDSTDLFELRRIPLPDDCSISELLVKTSGLWGVLRRRRSRSSPVDQTRLSGACPQEKAALPSLRA
jgi:poly-beta-1,6-N-acetyl-D-glucosamine N-deacetylase